MVRAATYPVYFVVFEGFDQTRMFDDLDRGARRGDRIVRTGFEV